MHERGREDAIKGEGEREERADKGRGRKRLHGRTKKGIKKGKMGKGKGGRERGRGRKRKGGEGSEAK